MPSPPPPNFIDDLALSLDQAWSLLEHGASDRRAPAHTPTLASLSLDGSPSLRTVVLRACSRSDRRLLVHTDRRSRKIEELLAEPRCSVLVYDPPQKIQLRLGARATLHLDGALADLQWSRSQETSRQIYGVGLAPGQIVSEPATVVADLALRSEAEQRANFAVLALEVFEIEWLYLSAQGHRRARFRLGGRDTAEWWVP